MKKAIENLKPLDAAAYDAVDLDRLVVYAAAQLENIGAELSLENIVVAAFKLFPKKFSLPGYPEFPDAGRVEKSLWRSKGTRRRWIGGKTPHGYLLTDRTRMIASQTEEELCGHVGKKPKPTSRMRRKETILREVTASSAYSKYVAGNADAVSEAEFCYVLQATLDSSPEVLTENLVALKRIAEDLERRDILEVLTALEVRFPSLLNKRK